MSSASAFQQLSIRNKLRLVVLASCLVSLAVACAAVFFAAPTWRISEVRNQLATLATLVGHSAAPALERNDPSGDTSSGMRTLDVLRGNPHLLVAAIYRESGDVFAVSRRNDAEELPPLPLPAVGFHSTRLEMVQSIESASGVVLGKVYLRADRNSRLASTRDYLLIVLMAGALCTLVALLMVSRLEKLLTGPLGDLRRTVEQVGREESFSARAAQAGPDELGQLVNAFNDMLAKFQLRDADLRRHRDHLGELVAQRTAELLQLNQALVESKDKAGDADRAKSHFLTNMSHELRTPLNAIIGYSDMLIEDPASMNQPEALADVRRINAAGRHLLTLINEVLDLSKLEAGRVSLQCEEFDLIAVIREVFDTLRPLAVKNEVRLERDCPLGLLPLHADRAKVRQVIASLVGNACKFTTRGEVRLRVSTETTDGKPWVNIEVIDTGIGMSEEQLAHLFQAFSKGSTPTTRKFGGTGLGLAISKRLTEAMGGKLLVTSKQNFGSTFTVRLPAQPKDVSENSAPAAAPVPPSGPQEGTPTVLVIDDDPHSRDLMVRFLQKEGFSPHTALDGQQGLLMAKQLRPALITLDVMMPEVDGWSVLGALKEDPELAKIPVVMITLTDEHDKGFALGASEFLTKPVDYSRLSGLLREYCPTPDDRPVLIVEDDEISSHLLRRNLEKEGYPVMLAGNGRDALEQIQMRLPSLILLDLMMPEMDGFAFAQIVRERKDLRNVPIIVLTAKDLTEEDRQRLKGNVTGILQKQTLSPEAFRSELRAAMAGHLAAKPQP